MRGESGGGIFFSADPVGVGVATCLHSISLLNEQILANLYKYIIRRGKMLIRFWRP